MTNTKLFLLIGTSLSLIPHLTFAQCVATQDCATLGYTETSCSGGSGVKCPFGNKWACFKSESEFCTEYGFTQTCTGTNQTGGSGKACNGKYNYCSCADGYVWQNGACQQPEKDYSECTVGTLFYSDGTCLPEKLESKTLLGVVIYEKSSNENGWIMSINPVKTNITWGWLNTDIPELSNCSSETCLTDVQSSCVNTDAIIKQGDSNKFPAAWAAKNYNPAGTPTDKRWCLPSGGLLNKGLNNATNFNKIKNAIITAGGTALSDVYFQRNNIWSSSEYTDRLVWRFWTSMSSFDMTYSNKSDNNYMSVYSVMPF